MQLTIAISDDIYKLLTELAQQQSESIPDERPWAVEEMAATILALATEQRHERMIELRNVDIFNRL